MCQSNRSGVSYLEMFGVLVIVTVLFLILYPVFAPRHEHGSRGTSCASNMKQLGLGFIQYVQDYDNNYPGGGNYWAGDIYSYEKSTGVYKCPDDKTENAPPLYRISYAMNANLSGSLSSDSTAPERTVLATEIDGTPSCDFTTMEHSSLYTTGETPNTAWGSVRLGTVSPSDKTPPRHDPAVMFLGCDGHVKLLHPEKVSSGIDALLPADKQDASHAAGTKAVGSGTQCTLTFSEK